MLVICAILALGAAANNTISNIKTNSEFKTQLEFAVSDTSPTRAAERFDRAALFLEQHNLDRRDICVFVYNPLCDTSEFHRKLTEAAADLRASEKLDAGAKNQTLIRMRESFVTSGANGEQLAYPETIFRTVAWFNSPFLGWLMSGIITTGSVVVFVVILMLVQ